MNTLKQRRPNKNEFNPFYQTYMDCVESNDVLDQLENQIGQFRSLLDKINESDTEVLHDPYTWTIKQVIGHMIDAEKIFGSRIHRFACGDQQPVPGMDQSPYVANLDYTTVTKKQLTDELDSTRRSNLGFLKRIPSAAWDNVGTADGNKITVRALAHILVGHVNHHMRIVRQRIG